MLKSYLKTIWRNLLKHRRYTLINVLGLSVGLACCILILLFVRLEFSFDRFHEKSDRIYRLATEVHLRSGQVSNLAFSAAPAARALCDDYPEVETATRILNRGGILRYNEEQHHELFFFVDTTFFDVFSFPLLRGDPETALDAPGSLLLTREMADRYFGDEDPLDQTLTFADSVSLKVTGVLADVPSNSQMQFDFLATMGNEPLSQSTEWGRLGLWTYLVLSEGASAAGLEDKLPNMVERHAGEWARELFHLHLQPLRTIYFDSNLLGEIGPTGDRMYVYIFGAIGIFVLVIACINFMNLATARSFHRAREIGMRKVLGAGRGRIVRQFMGEALVLAFIALLFALVFIELLLPFFSDLVQRRLEVDYMRHLGYLLVVALVVGIISGSYPALFLSAFDPVRALKGNFQSRQSGKWVRKGLVVKQFGISIVLLIGTGIVYQQLRFIQNKRLGFNKDQVVIIRLDQELQSQHEVFKTTLKQNADIDQATSISATPGMTVAPRHYFPAEAEEEGKLTNTFWVDTDLLETFQMELAAGRYFSKGYTTDTDEAWVINEAAVGHFGWDSAEDAIGRQLLTRGDYAREGSIVGVVKNFHYASLREEIQPLVMRLGENYRHIAVRIQSGRIVDTMAEIERTWTTIAADYPFISTFLDDQMQELYEDELRLGKIFGYFAVIAVVIACMGLFGLAAFTATQRTREVGVRKVLGAGVVKLAVLLSREYLILVLVANVLAWPCIYLVMRRWLDYFVYRIDISWITFIYAGLAAALIALLSVSYFAVKTALTNPVESLQYE